jgi:hypothetical protein
MIKEKRCIFKKDEENFRQKMQELIETGASRPTQVSMTDWYYMQRHAYECAYCAKKFERLAKKARRKDHLDGPTTLL